MAPQSGHETNHSKLSYLIDTQYYISLDSRRQTVNFGPKPASLPPSRRAWKRDIKHLEYLNNHSFVLDEARRYQDCFERKGVDTKAEVAEIFGVSRARITQYLNLLDLPKSIIRYLEEHQNNLEIRKLLTERRLRPLTWIDNKEECIRRFESIISRASHNPQHYVAQFHRRSNR